MAKNLNMVSLKDTGGLTTEKKTRKENLPDLTTSFANALTQGADSLTKKATSVPTDNSAVASLVGSKASKAKQDEARQRQIRTAPKKQNIGNLNSVAVSSLVGSNATQEERREAALQQNKIMGAANQNLSAQQRRGKGNTAYMLSDIIGQTNGMSSTAIASLTGSNATARDKAKAWNRSTAAADTLMNGEPVHQITDWSTGDPLTNKLVNALDQKAETSWEQADAIEAAAKENYGQYLTPQQQTISNIITNIEDNTIRMGKRMALSFLTGGSALAGVAGDAAMYLSSAGEALKDARDKGFSDDTARKYASIVGMANAGLEHLGDPTGTESYGLGLDEDLSNIIKSAQFLSPKTKWVANWLAGGFEEGLEELMTEALTQWAGKQYLNEDISSGQRIEDRMNAFGMGMISSLFLSGVVQGDMMPSGYKKYAGEIALDYWRMDNADRAEVVNALSKEFNVDPALLQKSIEDHALDAVKYMDGETLMRAIENAPVAIMPDGEGVYEYFGERTSQQEKALKLAARPGNKAYLVETLGTDSKGYAIPSATLDDGTVLISSEVEDPMNGIATHEVVHVVKDPEFIAAAQQAMREIEGSRFDSWLDSLKGAYAPMYTDLASTATNPIQRNQENIEYGRARYESDPVFRQKIDEEVASYFAQYHLLKDQKTFDRFMNRTGNLLQRTIQSLKDNLAGTGDQTLVSNLENQYTRMVQNYQKQNKSNFLTRLAGNLNANKLSPQVSYSLKSMGIDLAMGTDSEMVQDLLNTGVFQNQEEATNFVNNVNQLMDLLSQRAFLDMHEEADRDTRAFHPIKKNSDKLYEISLDYSTLCKKRIITQAIIEKLNVERGQALDARTQFAITELLRQYQQQESKLQVACALCYVEAARLKSPKVINQFINDPAKYMTSYFVKQGGSEGKQIVADAQNNFKTMLGVDPKATKTDMADSVAQRMTVGEFNDVLRSIGTAEIDGDPDAMVTPQKVKNAYNNYAVQLRESLTDTLTDDQKAAIELAKSLDRKYYLTAQGLTDLKMGNVNGQYNPLARDIYNAFTNRVTTATRSKAIETDVAYYYGDAKGVSDSLIERMNAENGIRTQSWSDFTMQHLLDEITSTAELATRNAKMHGYTKVPEYVLVKGKTGEMINNSLIPLGRTGFDEYGNLAFSPTEGMPIEESNRLRGIFPNTDGSICIGINDEQIRALLRDDRIDYVIPYHVSGLTSHLRTIAGINKWENYTGTQNETPIPGRKQGAAIKFSDWYTDDIKNQKKPGIEIMMDAQQNYLDLCAERGYIPKFPQFLINNGDGTYSIDPENPNYWKLLIDRKMINQLNGRIIEQKAVRPDFNWEDTYVNGERVPGLFSLVKEAEDPMTTELVERMASVVRNAIDDGTVNAIAENNPNVRGVMDFFIQNNPIEQLGEEDVDEYEWNGDPYDPATRVDVDIQTDVAPPSYYLQTNIGGQHNDIAAAMYSLSDEELDRQYFDALTRGDDAEAQRLVEDRGNTMGYNRHSYHGTMNGGFTQFDRRYANPEGNSGAGFYSTTDYDDANDHYRNVEGADNFFKRSTLAEQIFESGEWNGEPVDNYDDAYQIATDELNKNPQLYELRFRSQNPYTRNFYLSDQIDLYDDARELAESEIDRDDYDSEDDYEDDLNARTGEAVWETVDRAVYDALSDIEDHYEILDDLSPDRIRGLIDSLAETAIDNGNLNWNSIQQEVFDFAEDYTAIGDSNKPDYLGGELTRAIIENLGYDAIIDKEVDRKFNQVQAMPGTEHYIAFSPGQYKLNDTVTYDDEGNVIPLSQRFNPNNPDIRYSLSDEEDPTYYKDLRFDTVADRDAFAEAHPDYVSAREMEDIYDDEEYDNAESARDEALRDFDNYEKTRLRFATRRELFDHPERFNFNDIDRFLDSFSPVSLEETVEDYASLSPEEAIREVEKVLRDEEYGEYADENDWNEFLDSGRFLARIAPGASQEEIDRIVNEHANAIRPQNAEDVPTDDASYMAAVMNGDTELQQQMVDARAREQGYDTPHLYHGTPTGGFTEFDPSRSNQSYRQRFGKGMYFADREDVANHYMWNRDFLPEDQTNPMLYDVYLNSPDRIVRDVRDGTPLLSDVYVARNPNQIKSAEPITYDDNGNVIPLSQRFNPESNDIRYSLAVENGDVEEQERLVEEAARASGYDSPKLYHGTTEFGFTQVDPSKGDDGFSFWATDSLETANSYAYGKGVKNVSERLPFTEKDLRNESGFWRNDDGVLKYLDQLGIDYTVDDSGSRPRVRVPSWDSSFNSGGFDYNVPFRGDYLTVTHELYDRYLNKSPINEAFGVSPQSNTTGVYQLYGNTDGFFEVDAKGNGWQNIGLGANALDFDHWWTTEKGHEPNFNGVPWSTSNTRNIAAYAKDRGYPGVVIRNVVDDGGRSGFTKGKISLKSVSPASVYIFFDPQNQVKSADPVVYDDNGNVIPLDQRFNPDNPDMRYALSEEIPEQANAFPDRNYPQDRSAMRMLGQMSRDRVAADPLTYESISPESFPVPDRIQDYIDLMEDEEDRKYGFDEAPEKELSDEDRDMYKSIAGNKSGALQGFATPTQMFNNMMGKEGEQREFFRDRYERPMFDTKKEYNANREQRWQALENMIKETGIEANTPESAAVQWYGEKAKPNEAGETIPYTLADLKKEFPNKWQDIVKMERFMRGMYDEYVGRINAALEQVYPNLEEKAQAQLESWRNKKRIYQDEIEMSRSPVANEYWEGEIAKLDKKIAKLEGDLESGEYFRNKRLNPRKDYFHHFQEVETKGIGGLKNILQASTLIDPELVGKSANTKPKSRWMSWLQRRGQGAYTADAVLGMGKYIDSAEYAIAFDPLIAQYRDEISKMVKATRDTKNANQLIQYLSSYTNQLAGKTASLDRTILDLLGEGNRGQLFNVLSSLNNRAKSNAVVMNLRSAVAQIFNIPNAMSIIKSNSAWGKGVQDYISAKLGNRELLDQSPFLQERYFKHNVDDLKARNTNWEKIAGKLGDISNVMMELGDREATELIWLAAYNEGKDKGVSDPVYYADDLTRQSVAGRGIGEVPYNMKSKVASFFMPFQVETNNAWQNMKGMLRDKDGRGIFRLMLGSFLMNAMVKPLFNDGVVPDILAVILEGIKKLFDKDREESAGEVALDTAKRMAGEAVSYIPGTSLWLPAIMSSETAEDLFGESDPTRYGTGTVGLSTITKTLADAVNGDGFDLMTPLLQLGLPYGGRQASRLYNTLQDFNVLPSNGVMNTPFGGEKTPATGDYSKAGALKYRLPDEVDSGEDLAEILRAFAFGSNATNAAAEYFETGKPALSKERVEKLREHPEVNADTYIDYLREANTDGKAGISQAEAYKWLSQQDLTDEEKNALWNMTSSSWTKSYDEYTPQNETLVNEADADGNGRVTQAEAYDWLSKQDIPVEEKEAMWAENGWKKSYKEYSNNLPSGTDSDDEQSEVQQSSATTSTTTKRRTGLDELLSKSTTSPVKTGSNLDQIKTGSSGITNRKELLIAADSNNDGYMSQKEAYAYLSNSNLSDEEKNALWNLSNWKTSYDGYAKKHGA